LIVLKTLLWLIPLLWLAPLPWTGSLAAPAPTWAGPVEWREVPASADGRQWWDAGSLRRDRRGTLSVLSRFQPASAPENPQATLYVMDLDCAQGLYCDRSINGLPQFGAAWSTSNGDPLATAVLEQACSAAPPLAGPRATVPTLAPAPHG
jgi:hypothetical protein